MAPDAKVIEVAAKAGLTVVESSLLGAFSVICLLVGVAGIVVAFRTQNARVEDQKKLSEKLEGLVTEQGKLNAQTTLALGKLSDSDSRISEKMGELTTAVQTVSTGVSTLTGALVRPR